MDKNKHQKISSLALAAALVAWGFSIVTIEKSGTKKVVFIILNSPELQKSIQSYWDGTKSVLPLTYFDSLRHCKSRIYGGF